MNDAELIEEIRELLSEKMQLDLPDDTDPQRFLRDLYAALHGHPGWVAGADGGADLDAGDSDDDYDDEADDDQLSGYDARGSNTSGPAMRSKVLSHRRRVSAARGRQAAAEVLRNLSQPTPSGSTIVGHGERVQSAVARLSHQQFDARQERRDGIIAELRRNCPGVFAD